MKELLEYITTYNPSTKIWSGDVLRGYNQPGHSMGCLIFEAMRRNPGRVCQICDSAKTVLTNGEVLQQAIRIAKYFQSIGLKQSDIVGVVGRNTTYMMGVILACLFSGSAFHALNTNFDKKTSIRLFNITKPTIIFCDGSELPKLQSVISECSAKVFTMSQHIAGVPTVMELLQPTDDEYNFRPAQLERGPDQSAAILCSSGTSGLPKTVTISNSKRILSDRNFHEENDVEYHSSTIDWISGLMNLLCSIMSGTLRIISDRPWSAEYFLEIVQRYGITHTIMAPQQIAALLACPQLCAQQLKSLRYLMFVGSKCLPSTLRKMQTYLLNGRVVARYGLTEVGKISINFNLMKKPESVGRLFCNVRVRIVSAEGFALGPGVVGEIYCHTGQTWNGYYNNEQATREMQDAAGWFHTGDLGYFDMDNYLYIVDRKKDILKCQRMQYSPYEIEKVIAEMRDVLGVCVFGIWSELFGDEAAAAVVTAAGSTLTEQDVVEYVRCHIEATYKHLRAGAIILKTIPTGANGKVNRKAVKQVFLGQKGISLHRM